MDKADFALVGSVLGIGFLVCILWGAINSWRAKNNSHHRSKLPGIIGSICLLGFLLSVLWPIYASAKMSGKISEGHQLMKGWFAAMMMYAADNGDRLPPAENWSELCEPYWESELEPSLRDPVRGYDPGIALNSFCGGKSFEDDDWDPEIVMFAAGHKFDSPVTDGNYIPDPGGTVLLPDGYGHVITHQDSAKWKPD